MNEAIKNELQLFYKRLKKVEESEVILHAWSYGDEDHWILIEIIEFYLDNQNELKCDWFEVFYQIYSWKFQLFHDFILVKNYYI